MLIPVRFMPPSMPMAGVRRIAIVFARLVVDEEDRGVRPFIVPLNDGKEMNKGVQSWYVLTLVLYHHTEPDSVSIQASSSNHRR